jgi:hypothetical protein
MLIRFSPMKLDPKIAVEAVIGLSVGNIVSLPPLVIQHEFAARSFGLLVGLNVTVGTLIIADLALFWLAHDFDRELCRLCLCNCLQLASALIILCAPRVVREPVGAVERG